MSLTAAPSLRRVLSLRLAGAGLASLLALLAVLGAVYKVQQQRLQALWQREAQAHFERQVQRVESDWVRQADLLRAQIEFAGLLDEADERRAALRFTAFFASLGGESTFTRVAVRTLDGRVLARYATRSGGNEPAADDVAAGWRYSPADGILYRVLTAPLRMGARGRGEMVLFVPLNNALVDAIAFPEASISLHWREFEDLAVSASYQQRAAGTARSTQAPLEARFEWTAAAGGPQLHVYRDAPTVLPLEELLALAGAGVAGGALLAWLAIGRWSRRHVDRIDQLASAVDDFAARLRDVEPLAATLEQDGNDAGGELRRLGTGLAAMMRTTEAAVAETVAARDRLAALNATLEERVAERTRELESARDEALAAARARQHIMAAVSHELRTPLVGLLGSLELVDTDELPAAQRRLVETARRSGQALRSVVDDVLDYSRLEAVGTVRHEQPFRPDEVAGDVVALYAAVALNKGLSLQCHCDESTRRPVLGDAARLRQVLLNLVGNALKFTDRGHVTLRIVPVPGEAGRLRFEVEDSGIGIDATLREQLFNPFVQADADAAASRGGTGLGLSIAQRLVVAMGGRIEVDSTPGRGSTFWFELRLRAADPVPATAPERHADADTRLQARVLLVDDNPVNRMIGGEMLRRLGLQVEEAENGLLAIEALRRAPADLVLMDLQMPVLDGAAATRCIRQGEAGARLARVPIVAMTAYALDGDAERCLAAGMDDHLPKPFTQAELQAALRRWLVQRAASASSR